MEWLTNWIRDKNIKPLFDAVLMGRVKAIGHYLERGGDPNLRDRDGRTLLINAAILNDLFVEGYAARLEVAGLLLDRGADPDAHDLAGWTALHFSAQNQDAPMANLLLDKGAAIDPQDVHGNTPLQKAIFYSGGAGRPDSDALSSRCKPA